MRRSWMASIVLRISSQSALDERLIERTNELHLAEELVVLPERVDDERRLVFLDRQHRLPVRVDPGMPAAAECTGWRELVQEVAVRRDDVGTEVEERAGDFAIATVTQRRRHPRAVARPHIGVAVAG